MQHSYEALDRPGAGTPAPSGLKLLSPLRHRDFRVLWSGIAVSLVGDGIFLVAVAWEAYTLWNAPAALALVGIGMSVPMVLFLLPGGVLSDRLDRRSVLIAADCVRGSAVAALALLALMSSLQMWQLVLFVGIYGIGTAFFTPAFDAVVPDLLPTEALPAANSLDQLVRPIAFRLAGPALGGVLVAAGVGIAFAVDALTFAVSILAVVAMHAQPNLSDHAPSDPVKALGEGFRFVRQRVWLWGTLVSAALAYLVFMGPTEVLLPSIVKNDLHASPAVLGLVFAAGGLGAIGAAIVMGQRRHPRRDVTVMYVSWTVATLAVAGYGIAVAPWQLMLACLVFNALETVGTIVWATMKQRHVPAAMLGRVSSLDWLISIGLLPLSFALTAPVADAIGARATLVGAGVIGAVITFSALYLPGVRAIEGLPAENSGRPPTARESLGAGSGRRDLEAA
jgi:DHA3 family tetracycline resistance protein-like MFS transporter